MRKRRFIGLLSAIVALFASGGATADNHTHSLTYSAWLPPPLQQCGLLRVLTAIEEASNGRVRFEQSDVKPAAPGKVYQQLVDGSVDVIWDATPFSPEQFPLTNLMGLPFVADDHVAASRALHSLASEHLADEFTGLRLIALHTNGLYQFHMRTPIETIEDLKDKQVRVPGPTMAAAVEALGGKPVKMSPFEAQEKLANDEIDGIAIEWGVPWLLDVTQHHLGLDIMVTPFFVAINEGAYSKLPEDLRVLIDAQSVPETSGAIAGCFAVERAREAIDAAKAAGHGVVILSDEDRAGVADKLQPVTENRLEELEARGLAARAFYAALIQAVEEEQSKR